MAKSKKMCRGCYNDFYNHRTNCDGKSECFSFRTAKVVKRVRVGTWEPPPYAKERAAKYLSCYHCQGSAFLLLDDCRVKSRAAIAKEKAKQPKQ